MIEVEDEIVLPVPPPSVWKVLVDLEGYPEWNPYVAMRGVAEPEGDLEWSLGSTALKRRIWTKAAVTEFDHPIVLSWSFGSPFVFGGEERFLLEPTAGGGTRLKHSLRYKGIIAAIRRKHLRTTMKDMVEQSNRGLRRYFEVTATKTSTPNRTSETRNKGRRTRK